MIEPDEAAVALTRLECDRMQGPGARCCPAGTCHHAGWRAAEWMETARALKVSTADLLALARGEAVIRHNAKGGA